MSIKLTYEQLERRVRDLEKKAAEQKQFEKGLQGSEKKYRDMVEKVTNVGILVAQDGKLVFTNTAISDILGYTKEELTSHPNPFDLIHPDDRTMVLERHMKRQMKWTPCQDHFLFFLSYNHP